MTYLTTAEVDISQLIANYKAIKAAAGGTRVLCVVKADAYGHGAIECSKALYGAGADYFAVANLPEAIEIRPYVGDSGILILGSTPPSDVPLLIEYGVRQAVYSLDYALAAAENVPQGKKLLCHLKLDTGMNRIGFRAAYGEDKGELEQIMKAVSLPQLSFEGVFTHFALSDTPSSSMTHIQFGRFTETLGLLEERGVKFPIRHASNSAAIYNYPETRLDMVRAGIILYGFAPSEDTPAKGCLPIMTLRTTVTHIHTLCKGESVGYGATFTAAHDMRIATLAIGYADGYLRAYSGVNSLKGMRGSVFINGAEAPILGRICMDQCLCDVSAIDVKPGDKAVIFDKINTADRLASAANTINYEVTSVLTRRVKRIYTGIDLDGN